MIELTFTDNEKEIINRQSSFKQIRLEFPDHEIEDIGNSQVALDAMSLEESLCESDNLTFGKCNGSIFKIRVADFTENIENARMNVYVKFTNEELGEVDVPFGRYIISQPPERTSDRRWRDIIATDYMTLFDVDIADWYNNTLYPTSETTRTVKYIRTELCKYIGVECEDTTLINDDLIISKTVEPTSLSGRDLLQNICEINACFGHFDWDGILKFITLDFSGLYPSENLFPSKNLYPRGKSADNEYILSYKQDKCNYEDYDVKEINAVAITKEEGGLAVVYRQPQVTAEEEVENRYNITGNILLYGHNTTILKEIAEGICKKISGCAYRQNSTEVYGGIYMTLGQSYVVNAKVIVGSDIIDNTFESYVLKRTIKGIQAMSQILEAKGEQYQPETQTHDIISELAILRGKSASYKRELESLEVEYKDFSEDITSKYEQTNSEIVLSVDSHGNVVAVELSADREKGSTNFNVGADNISLAGKTIDLTGENIKINSNNFSVDSNGDVVMNVSIWGVEGLYNSSYNIITTYNIIGIYDSLPTPSAEYATGENNVIVVRPSSIQEGTYYSNRVYTCRYTAQNYRWISVQLLRSSTLYTKFFEASFVIDNENGITLKSKQFEIDGDGNAMFRGDVVGGSININDKFNVDQNGNLNINDKFNVDQNGNLNINDKVIISNQGNIRVADAFYINNDGSFGCYEGDSGISFGVDGSMRNYSSATNSYIELDEGKLLAKAPSEEATSGVVYISVDGESITVIDYEGSRAISIKAGRIYLDYGYVAAENFVNISDERLKENIEAFDVNYEKAYYELQPILFNYIGRDTKHTGLIAQKTEETFIKYSINTNNCFVTTMRDEELGEKYSIDYTKFTTWNMHMIQKQHSEIEALKEENQTIKNELATLREQVAFLMNKIGE